MADWECLNALARHVNEAEVRREKYALPDGRRQARLSVEAPGYTCPALREPPVFSEPAECTWAFMQLHEVDALLASRTLQKVKSAIGEKLAHGYPKGLPRMIAVELLYGGFKFAKSCEYDATQTGALLSMLYMTQRYFNSCHRITAGDVYGYFKELLCFHSLDFCPSHRLVFTPEDAQRVLSYFCKIFLRHLPVIRLLGLPNFELAINTYIPPFPVFKKKKAKKEKGGKSSKGSKSSKKSKKSKK